MASEVEASGPAGLAMSLFDDSAGVVCNGCGEESLRIIEGKCMRCLNNGVEVTTEKLERKALTQALRKGTLRLADLKGPHPSREGHPRSQ